MEQLSILATPVIISNIQSIEINDLISKSTLDIEEKDRSNLFPWKGQFSPQLIEVLLDNYAKKGMTILDPFMGSGTVLVESAMKGLDVFGTELNPAAVKMAQFYSFINKSIETRKDLISKIEKKITKVFLSDSDIETKDKKILSEAGHLFFAKLKKIHGKLNADLEEMSLLETLMVICDPKDKILTLKKIFSTWGKMKRNLLELPVSETKTIIYNCDCRNIPLSSNEVDLVITSPPYINVFNYHQQKRKAVEEIGWDILSVARSEIGSNRKHRGNRLLTVIQYCIDMEQVLQELSRVTKKNAKIIFVVGRESNVRKTSFFNSQIIANIGKQSLGLDIEQRFERDFKNRFGQIIKEDILVFKNTAKKSTFQSHSRAIALQTLHDAKDRAPVESLVDLQSAIDSINKVDPSPIYIANSGPLDTCRL